LFLNPTHLVCTDLGLSVADTELSANDSCGARLGVLRGIIEDSQGLDPRDRNITDVRQRFKIDLDFQNLYNHVKIGQPSFLKILHVGSCELRTLKEVLPIILLNTNHPQISIDFDNQTPGNQGEEFDPTYSPRF